MSYIMHKEEKDHFVMHDKRDGKAFKVAKSGLSEAHMSKVRKMAEGGEVDDGEEDAIPTQAPSNLDALYTNSGQPAPESPVIIPEESANFASPADLDKLAAKLPRGGDNEKPEATAVNPNTQADMPMGGMQQTSYESPQSSTASAMGDLQASNDKIIGDQVKALQASGAAAQVAAATQAKIYADQAQKMQVLQQQTQQRYAALDKEQEQLKQDVASSKIEPNRIWANAGTGNKIMASIGILLSGMGSGLTGGPNLAMQVIDKTIDNDIAAQKAELGKKENLLSRNYRKYGDVQAATAATALQLNTITQAQIAAAASKASGPAAQAQAGQAIAQLQLQSNQYKQQIAMFQMAQPAQGPQGEISPQKLLMGIKSGYIPKDASASVMKEYGEYQQMKTAENSLKKAYQEVADLQSAGNRLGSPIQSRSQINKIKSAYGVKISKDTAGRVTPMDAEAMMDQFPGFSDNEQTKKVGLANLTSLIMDKYSFPTLQTYGYLPSGKSEERQTRDTKTGATLTNWKP